MVLNVINCLSDFNIHKSSLFFKYILLFLHRTHVILALIDKHLITAKTQDPALLFQAANYYYSTNRDYRQAIMWLEEAEKLNPENFYYPNLRQKIASESKDYVNAIDAAKKALALAEKEKMKSTIEMLKEKINNWETLLKK